MAIKRYFNSNQSGKTQKATKFLFKFTKFDTLNYCLQEPQLGSAKTSFITSQNQFKYMFKLDTWRHRLGNNTTRPDVDQHPKNIVIVTPFCKTWSFYIAATVVINIINSKMLGLRQSREKPHLDVLSDFRANQIFETSL